MTDHGENTQSKDLNFNDINDSIYMSLASYTLDSKNSVHCCVKIRREREREANKVAGPDRDTRDLNED